ncbi:tudor domain-containing protein 3 isoform X1 [Manihot esculenta]|uniref:Uncharacterized protein n=1 Tax=Manihot esculenta TaxID=3983 RepID=A0ACB7HYV0_MANES|nr:tudor domain-containing protein 3 isoform X1 [Manihot esculenta]KAG8657420.1 hypothetical protein MANES_03G066500v8 [Manihot esculenta]
MERERLSKAAEAVMETLRTRGWSIGDINQIEAIITIQSALSDDHETSAVTNSVESELLNMDLKSLGAKSLPDPNIFRKTSHLQGPKVLQVSSVRDISVSSIGGVSDSGHRRLLKLSLTDGHSEITAIEYSHIPSIPNDLVPGTKVRLENKIPIHSGILCLNPKVITLMGGVVPSLYEEWQMNQKYSGFSRSLMRLSQETDSGGPPQFEKLQIGAPFRPSSQQSIPAVVQSRYVQGQATAQNHLHSMSHPNRYSGGPKYRGKDKVLEPQVVTLDKRIDYSESTSKSSEPTTVETALNTEIRLIDSQQNADNLDDKVTDASLAQSIEQKPLKSEERIKEVAESAPVQNQAAAHKLLQKMNSSNQGDRRPRGWKHKGKGKQEELQFFTLDEWENRKIGANHTMKNDIPDTSADEEIAWQLQNQLDVEDSHVQMGMHRVETDIRMSMFNYGGDADRVRGMEHGGGGRGKGRGKGEGEGEGEGEEDLIKSSILLFVICIPHLGPSNFSG